MKLTAYNLSTKKYQTADVMHNSGGNLTVDFGDGIHQRIVENAMTEKQHDYLVDLGVNISGYETTMTKRTASDLISAAKMGEVEDMGFEMVSPVVSYNEPY